MRGTPDGSVAEALMLSGPAKTAPFAGGLLAGPLAARAQAGVRRPAHLGQPDLLVALAVRRHDVVQRAVAEERPLADRAAGRVAEVAVGRAVRAGGVGVRGHGVEAPAAAVVVDALQELVVVAGQAAHDHRGA